MRKFNSIGSGICAICNTSKEGECILIPIDGTDMDNICEAAPIHLDCINLRLNKDAKIIYQKSEHL